MAYKQKNNPFKMVSPLKNTGDKIKIGDKKYKQNKDGSWSYKRTKTNSSNQHERVARDTGTQTVTISNDQMQSKLKSVKEKAASREAARTARAKENAAKKAAYEKMKAEKAAKKKATPKATGKKNRVSHDPDYSKVVKKTKPTANKVDKKGSVSNISASNSLSAQYSNLMHDGSDFSKMTKTKSKKLRASEPIKEGTITNRGIVTSKKRFRNEDGKLVERVTIKNPKHKRRNTVGGSLAAEIQYQQSKNTAGTSMKKTKLKRKK
jgi:hypothetical protein